MADDIKVGKNILKCINYILKKNGYDAKFQSNSMILSNLSKLNSPFDILDKIKVSYMLLDSLDREQVIAFYKNSYYVVEKMKGNNVKVWDIGISKYKNIDIKELDKFSFIYIQSIAGEVLNTICRKKTLMNHLNNFISSLPYVFILIIITFLINILVFFLSIMIEMIVDSIIPAKSIISLANFLGIIFILILLLLVIIKIREYFIIRCQKKNKYSKYRNKILYTISATTLIWILYIFNYQYIEYFIYSLIFILIINILQVFLIRDGILEKMPLRIFILIKKSIYLLLVFGMIFLITIVYINNGVSRGIIFSTLVSYGYLVCNFLNFDQLVIYYLQEADLINNEYYKENMDRLLLKLDNLEFDCMIINSPYIKSNGPIKMKKSTFNEFIGGKGSGKTYIAKAIKGLISDTQINILYDNYSLDEIANYSVIEKCALLNNKYELQGKTLREYISSGNILLDSDIIFVLNKLGIMRYLDILDSDIELHRHLISDIDQLLLTLSKDILSNSKVIIFDNVLSRLEKNTVELIKTIIVDLNLIGIVLENEHLDGFVFDNIYYLDEIR